MILVHYSTRILYMPCMIIPLFLPTLVTVETGAKDGGYIHHLILCRGWLWKRSSNTSAVSSIQYRKRFFELSNMALTYTQNEKQTGVIALILYLMYTYYESTAGADRCLGGVQNDNIEYKLHAGV